MKQKTRWHDALVLAAVLCAAFLIVTGTQQITGRIDGVASMVFVLAVFLISIYTDGYAWGVVASLIGVLAVNFAFRSPYFAFNFTLPENLFSGMAMLVVSIMTSTLTTRIKKQEQLRMESETEKMRATLLRAVSHDLRTPLESAFTGHPLRQARVLFFAAQGGKAFAPKCRKAAVFLQSGRIVH